jgi:hypothetical protein
VEALPIFGKASVLPKTHFLGDFFGCAVYWHGRINQKMALTVGKTLVIQLKIWHR